MCFPWKGSHIRCPRKTNHLFVQIILRQAAHCKEKEMATHSSILAWRILWTEEPGGLLSMGLQSRTWLKRLSMHALEKAVATHTRVLAWSIPGTGEPAGLPCMGSHRVGHNWSDGAAAAAYCKSFRHTKHIRALTMLRNLMESIPFNIYHSISQTHCNFYVFGCIS